MRSGAPDVAKMKTEAHRLCSAEDAVRHARPGFVVGVAVAATVALAVAWYGVHHVAWFGAFVADGLRSIVGDEVVSRLEEWAYGTEDSVNRLLRGGERPRSYWHAPPAARAAPSTQTLRAPGPGGDAADAPAFRPADVGPLFPDAAAAGDGVWVPVQIPGGEGDAPLLYKTLVHPDRKRPWAELFVVAMDARRLHVSIVAGTDEPGADTAEGRAYRRTGLVPASQQHELVAVFNGGFKAEHGHIGMKVDGVTLLPPRDPLCTIAAYRDGTLRIASWKAVATGEGDMLWWRQTPACMVEHDTLHPGLANEANMYWGAAITGDTVVRRSALGLNAERGVLYMAVSNATTARAIALGMRHAGASDVAQLDVNWSYPRFVMFRRSGAGALEGFGLFNGFAFDKNDYVRRPSTRDFFYVERKELSHE